MPGIRKALVSPAWQQWKQEQLKQLQQKPEQHKPWMPAQHWKQDLLLKQLNATWTWQQHQEHHNKRKRLASCDDFYRGEVRAENIIDGKRLRGNASEETP